MEQVGRRKIELAVQKHGVFAVYIAITARDLLVFGIPNEQLLVRHLAGIVLVDIHFLARAAARRPERKLAQPPDLEHHIGRVVVVDDIDLVVAVIGAPHETVGGELFF